MTTRYLYDGDDVAAELDASGKPIRTYGYWPGIRSAAQHAAERHDPLLRAGPAVQQRARLVQRQQRGDARYHYGPFGEPQGASGSTSQPLRFAARELDATTGLYYVRARWYDAGMGRFISEDPIGLEGGINNDAYAADDPVNLSDPSGLCYGRMAVFILGVAGDRWTYTIPLRGTGRRGREVFQSSGATNHGIVSDCKRYTPRKAFPRDRRVLGNLGGERAMVVHRFHTVRHWCLRSECDRRLSAETTDYKGRE